MEILTLKKKSYKTSGKRNHRRGSEEERISSHKSVYDGFISNTNIESISPKTRRKRNKCINRHELSSSSSSNEVTSSDRTKSSTESVTEVSISSSTPSSGRRKFPGRYTSSFSEYTDPTSSESSEHLLHKKYQEPRSKLKCSSNGFCKRKMKSKSSPNGLKLSEQHSSRRTLYENSLRNSLKKPHKCRYKSRQLSWSSSDSLKKDSRHSIISFESSESWSQRRFHDEKSPKNLNNSDQWQCQRDKIEEPKVIKRRTFESRKKSSILSMKSYSKREVPKVCAFAWCGIKDNKKFDKGQSTNLSNSEPKSKQKRESSKTSSKSEVPHFERNNKFCKSKQKRESSKVRKSEVPYFERTTRSNKSSKSKKRRESSKTSCASGVSHVETNNINNKSSKSKKRRESSKTSCASGVSHVETNNINNKSSKSKKRRESSKTSCASGVSHVETNNINNKSCKSKEKKESSKTYSKSKVPYFKTNIRSCECKKRRKRSKTSSKSEVPYFETNNRSNKSYKSKKRRENFKIPSVWKKSRVQTNNRNNKSYKSKKRRKSSKTYSKSEVPYFTTNIKPCECKKRRKRSKTSSKSEVPHVGTNNRNNKSCECKRKRERSKTSSKSEAPYFETNNRYKTKYDYQEYLISSEQSRCKSSTKNSRKSKSKSSSKKSPKGKKKSKGSLKKSSKGRSTSKCSTESSRKGKRKSKGSSKKSKGRDKSKDSSKKSSKGKKKSKDLSKKSSKGRSTSRFSTESSCKGKRKSKGSSKKSSKGRNKSKKSPKGRKKSRDLSKKSSKGRSTSRFSTESSCKGKRKSKGSSKKSSKGRNKSKKSPKGRKKSRDLSKKSSKGRNTSKCSTESSCKGKRKSMGSSKKSSIGRKKSKDSSKKSPKGRKKSRDLSNKSSKGRNTSKCSTESSCKGKRKSMGSSKKFSIGRKKSKDSSKKSPKGKNESNCLSKKSSIGKSKSKCSTESEGPKIKSTEPIAVPFLNGVREIKILNACQIRKPSCYVKIAGQNYKGTFNIGLDAEVDKVIENTLKELGKQTSADSEQNGDGCNRQAVAIIENCFTLLQTMFKSRQISDGRKKCVCKLCRPNWSKYLNVCNICSFVKPSFPKFSCRQKRKSKPNRAGFKNKVTNYRSPLAVEYLSLEPLKKICKESSLFIQKSCSASCILQRRPSAGSVLDVEKPVKNVCTEMRPRFQLNKGKCFAFEKATQMGDSINRETVSTQTGKDNLRDSSKICEAIKYCKCVPQVVTINGRKVPKINETRKENSITDHSQSTKITIDHVGKIIHVISPFKTTNVEKAITDTGAREIGVLLDNGQKVTVTTDYQGKWNEFDKKEEGKDSNSDREYVYESDKVEERICRYCLLEYTSDSVKKEERNSSNYDVENIYKSDKTNKRKVRNCDTEYMPKPVKKNVRKCRNSDVEYMSESEKRNERKGTIKGIDAGKKFCVISPFKIANVRKEVTDTGASKVGVLLDNGQKVTVITDYGNKWNELNKREERKTRNCIIANMSEKMPHQRRSNVYREKQTKEPFVIKDINRGARRVSSQIKEPNEMQPFELKDKRKVIPFNKREKKSIAETKKTKKIYAIAKLSKLHACNRPKIKQSFYEEFETYRKFPNEQIETRFGKGQAKRSRFNSNRYGKIEVEEKVCISTSIETNVTHIFDSVETRPFAPDIPNNHFFKKNNNSEEIVRDKFNKFLHKNAFERKRKFAEIKR